MFLGQHASDGKLPDRKFSDLKSLNIGFPLEPYERNEAIQDILKDNSVSMKNA